MASFGEQLRDWLARAEILARGAERRRQEAARALDAGRPWEARYEALAILDELPRSRVALALWADAAEATLLDHEAAEALERLAAEVPFRADVWLRLALVQQRLGFDPGRALELAAEAGEPTDAADHARVRLADRDLEAGDAPRAERWLDQLSLGARATPDALERRVVALLDMGAGERARAAFRSLPEPVPTNGRGWLVRARVLALDSPAAALSAFTRALLLDAPGALRVASEQLLRSSDASIRSRLRALVEDLGLDADPAWRAALATAEGRTRDALAALAEGASKGGGALTQYLDAALSNRDAGALADAMSLAEADGRPVEASVRALAAALRETDPRRRLNELDAAGGSAGPWAAALRQGVYESWCPAASAANWPELLADAASVAHGLLLLDAVRDAEAIAVDLERPLRVVVVGEFNAGKSSFINALLGEVVAPVGVLPTTATVNRLVWAPDRFVRIERRAGFDEPDRVVSHADLRQTLSGLDPGSIERATIYAPLEPLRRIELVDTPGFNAPDPRHSERARAAFRDAHVAIWLLDAAQPLKESERAILAEIRGLEVPLLVLLNKVDRLSDEQAVSATVQHVTEGLAGAGIELEEPPVALSARLALEGRSSPQAFARSRWTDVERLVEDVLVNRSSALRERALRRRFREITARFAQSALERAEQRARRSAELEARNAALRGAVDRAMAQRTELESALEGAVSAALQELERDLRPVAGVSGEPAARRFIAARARKILGAALASRAAAFLRLEAELQSVLEGHVRPRIEAAAAVLVPWLRWREPSGMYALEGRSRIPELARAELVAAVADELARVMADEIAPLPTEKLEPAEVRAEALAAALRANHARATLES